MQAAHLDTHPICGNYFAYIGITHAALSLSAETAPWNSNASCLICSATARQDPALADIGLGMIQSWCCYCRQQILKQFACHLGDAELAELANLTGTGQISGRDLRDIAEQTERSWASKVCFHPCTHSLTFVGPLFPVICRYTAVLSHSDCGAYLPSCADCSRGSFKGSAAPAVSIQGSCRKAHQGKRSATKSEEPDAHILLIRGSNDAVWLNVHSWLVKHRSREDHHMPVISCY